jgi:hypothetical protein
VYRHVRREQFRLDAAPLLLLRIEVPPQVCHLLLERRGMLPPVGLCAIGAVL